MVTFEVLLDASGRLPRWSKPVTEKYGLYVFRSGDEIFRVGETSSGITRIAKGFRGPFRHIRGGKERKNYLAYSWREKHASKTIHVDFFDLPATPFSDSYFRRSLEAEVTFQFRIQMQKWPSEMSEIHFLECLRRDRDVVRQATKVLKAYGYRYRKDI